MCILRFDFFGQVTWQIIHGIHFVSVTFSTNYSLTVFDWISSLFRELVGTGECIGRLQWSDHFFGSCFLLLAPVQTDLDTSVALNMSNWQFIEQLYMFLFDKASLQDNVYTWVCCPQLDKNWTAKWIKMNMCNCGKHRWTVWKDFFWVISEWI